MKLNLRDLFWLLLVVGLALAWWLERRNSDRTVMENRRLQMEVKYLKSAAPPIMFIDAPMGDAVLHLAQLHRVTITFDWKTLKEEGIDYKKVQTQMPVTRNLQDGSLRTRLELICTDYNLAAVSSADGLLITTKKAAAGQDAPDSN
jgi:hypothetical protein